MHERSTRARRLAVVSGAASGIGLAAAQTLLRRGTRVVGVDLAQAPASLPLGDGDGWIAGDVADPDTWTRVRTVSQGLDARGADCFVGCAGTVVPGALLDAPLDEWRRMFDVNVLGVVLALQALVPPMRDQGDGAIAVVCSISSFQVEPSSGAYCASKGALLQVVRAAALEHARHGLRINAVCPGIVDTPLLRRFVDAADDPAAIYTAMEQRTPTGRMVSAQEVADVLHFLVGPGVGGLSGAALTIDGGLTTTYDFDASAP